MSTQLSPHFTLNEMILSQTATRLGIDNTPSDEIIEHLRTVAINMEVVRSLLGNRPIHISSGYRSPTLNAAIGGARTSAHMSGYAVDFTCPEFGDPFAIADWLNHRLAQFDQLIYEFGQWVHLSFAPTLRGQRLTILAPGQGYLSGIVKHAPGE
jgi:hypothetical protein